MDEMEWSIRELETGDLPAALTLWSQVEGLTLRDVDGLATLRSYLERNPGLSYVAEAAGELVGAVLCGHDGRRGYLQHLAVVPALRRRGIGRALAEQCRAALRVQGIEKCHLMVRSENADALAFWTGTGWLRRRDIALFSANFGGPDA